MSEKKIFTFEEIKQKLVNYCIYQDRCHKDVEEKMKQFMLIPEAKDEIILFLLKENYLNEERFARSYTRGKFYIKNWGKNKIRTHLLQKGINEKLINTSFEEITNEDYIKTIKGYINKLLPTYRGLQEYQKKQKVIKFLITKGYEYDIILQELSS